MPKLYLMLGYPGAGKTTAAREIAKLTGAVHLWADQERRRMFLKPTYSHEENLQLYKALNQKTDQLLAEGKSVVFDTNFNFVKDRQNLRAIADKHGADCQVIWVKTQKQLARDRAVHHVQKDTRVLGHMSTETFDRMSSQLEEPTADEQVAELDGTKITADYVAQELGL